MRTKLGVAGLVLAFVITACTGGPTRPAAHTPRSAVIAFVTATSHRDVGITKALLCPALKPKARTYLWLDAQQRAPRIHFLFTRRLDDNRVLLVARIDGNEGTTYTLVPFGRSFAVCRVSSSTHG